MECTFVEWITWEHFQSNSCCPWIISFYSFQDVGNYGQPLLNKLWRGKWSWALVCFQMPLVTFLPFLFQSEFNYKASHKAIKYHERFIAFRAVYAEVQISGILRNLVFKRHVFHRSSIWLNPRNGSNKSRMPFFVVPTFLNGDIFPCLVHYVVLSRKYGQKNYLLDKVITKTKAKAWQNPSHSESFQKHFFKDQKAF